MIQDYWHVQEICDDLEDKVNTITQENHKLKSDQACLHIQHEAVAEQLRTTIDHMTEEKTQ